MRSIILAAALVLACGAIGQAQHVVVYHPAVEFVQPQVGYYSTYYAPRSVVVAPAPTMVHYAPAAPVRTVTYYSSVSSMPLATVAQSLAMPVTVPVAAPVVAYRPAVVARPAYVIGRGVVGQPKVYIPGQPIRNSVRFVSP